MLSAEEARAATEACIVSRERPDVSHFLSRVDAEIRKATELGEVCLYWHCHDTRSQVPTSHEWNRIIQELLVMGYRVYRDNPVNGVRIEWGEWGELT